MPRNKSGHSRLTAENEYGAGARSLHASRRRNSADGVLFAPDLSLPKKYLKKYFTQSAEQ